MGRSRIIEAMTVAVPGRSDAHEALSDGWVVGAGVATTVVATVCGMALQAWAQGPPPRHDYFEPFLDPWKGLTWITLPALWIASIARRWPWLPLTAIGLCFVVIQVWMVIGAAWNGLKDGQVGGLGALAGALSVTQIGLTLAWIVLIRRSKRMPS